MTINEELAEILAKSLNKGLKDQKIAYFLDDDSEGAPTNVKDWISTGSSMLDLAISNRPYGGVPVGRITEISGLEQTGKSLVCAHILKETQKKGGVAVMIDTEAAVSREFFEAVGIDISKLLYLAIDTVEDIFASIEKIIMTVRESTTKDKCVTIVIDSIAAASTKQEMESEYDKDGWNTGKAIITGKAFRKLTNMIARERISVVFTNQLRQKLGVTFGDPWTTSGGKSMQFHTSIRVRLKKISTIKVKERGIEKIIGVRVRALVFKNRLGPPERTAEFDIMYDSGIDDLGGWFLTLKKENLVTVAGAWFTYTAPDGTEAKFQTKNFSEVVLGDPDLKEKMYNHICDTVIMKYKELSSANPSELVYDDGGAIEEDDDV